MTPQLADLPSSPTVEHALGIRSTFIVLWLVASLCAVGSAVFLGFTLVPRAMEVRTATDPVVRLFGALGQRVQVLHGSMPDVHRLAAQKRVDTAAVSRVRARIATLSNLPPVQTPAGALETIGPAVARTGRDMAMLESALRRLLDLVEQGRLDSAGQRFASADSLRRAVDNDESFVQRQGLEYLVSSRIALDAAARQAVWGVALILVLAVVFPLVFLHIWRRRFDQPLAELGAALDRVGSGDLTAALPVSGKDEMSRLGEHFNAMTRILRDRAEGQGRFAATGELLAGIAHEVNNPLQAIAALVESRVDEPDLPTAQRKDYQQILQQTRRAGKLLSGLLHFVRPGEPQVADLDLADVVARVVDLLSYQFGVDEIDVDNRVGAGLSLVRADAPRLEQLFVNLLSNAIDAVRAVSPPRRITVEAWEHGGRLHVAVADNGRGIDRDIASRIFQPFVTTKGARGTGLGLYVSRQLAREIGGDLALRSTPGEGARLVAWFPAVRSTPVDGSRAAPPVADVPPAANGSGALAGLTVLVVDDEEAIRRPLVKYLSRLGATVIDAADGLDALTQLGLFAVDAIILDLRMPRMDGVEFYAALRAERPALAARVVFLSGDPEQLTAAHAGALPAGGVLAKPVDLKILTERIRRVVGRTP